MSLFDKTSFLKLSFLSCVFFCLATSTWAQTTLRNSNLLIEGRIGYGFLISHHPEMKVFNAHFPTFEINLGKETWGEKRWEAEFNYPIIGLSYWYSGLGNSEIVGQAHAVFPYISFPVFYSKNDRINFRLGVGLGYLTQKFENTTHYKYLAIGSHINAAGNFLLEYRHKFSPDVQSALGISMMHFSNGSTKTPNYGINVPSANFAMAFRLGNAKETQRKKVLPDLDRFEFPRKNYAEVSLGAMVAFKDMGYEYDKGFMIYNLEGLFLIPVSFKHSFGIGVDFTIDQSDAYRIDHQGVIAEKPFDYYRTGITGSYKLQVARLSFMFNAGAYTSGIHKYNPYFKIGLRYLVLDNLYASLTLRTHYIQADFAALGLGYRLPFMLYKPKRVAEKQ